MTRSTPAPRRLAIAALGLIGAALAYGGPAHAQFAAIQPGAKAPAWSTLPDWNGVWERDGHIGWDPSLPFDQPLTAPYNPEYLAKVMELRKKGGLADAGAACEGGGMPGMMTAVFPLEVEINPRQVTLMVEGQGQPRRLYTDGRGHPQEPFPSLNGHSVAQWRKGELFVETCCFRPSARIPGGGLHSDALTIQEHFWAPDPNTLKDEITIVDPKALTKPWSVVKTYRRRPTWEPVEYNCTENNRNPLSADGVAQVVLAGDDGFNPPPSLGEAATARPAAALKPVAAAGPFGSEGMQRATAVSLGNMAWESVTVEGPKSEGEGWTWTAATPTGRWRCKAERDGKNPYCER